MVSNKFVGHGIVIGIFVLQPILFNFGWENTLYLPGATPAYTYSDMNGYGHFVPALFWSIAYWFSIFAFLAVVSIAYTRRGAEDSLARSHRVWPSAALRVWSPRPRSSPCAPSAPALWYYYNAHVLNEYLTAKDRRHIQAGYERDFKKYELLPQPKVTAVDATINIYPERRSFDGTGRFTLQNKSTAPISQIHITDEQQSVSKRSIRPAVSPGEPGPARSVFHLRARSAARARGSAHSHVFRRPHHARLPRRERTGRVRLQRHLLRRRLLSADRLRPGV